MLCSVLCALCCALLCCGTWPVTRYTDRQTPGAFVSLSARVLCCYLRDYLNPLVRKNAAACCCCCSAAPPRVRDKQVWCTMWFDVMPARSATVLALCFVILSCDDVHTILVDSQDYDMILLLCDAATAVYTNNQIIHIIPYHTPRVE